MKNRLSYFVTRSSMFGIGFFLLFKNVGKDAWICILLGSLLGIGIIYLYHLIKNYFQNESIKEKLQKTFMGKIFLLLLILFYLYIMLIILILLPMFVNSFYLLYTPKILVVIPFMLLAIYIANKGKNTISNLSSLVFIFSIIIVALYFLLLIKYYDFNNLIPILTVKTNNLILATIIYASITTIPNILTINYPENNFKDDLKNYIYATITILFITLGIILALGEPLLNIYSFPEYDVLKQIKLLDFIENVENLSTFVWYFDLFVTLAVVTSNLKETLPTKYNKIYFYLLILIIVIVANFIIGENYRIISIAFKSYAFILDIFLLLFIGLLIYLKLTHKKHKKTLNDKCP